MLDVTLLHLSAVRIMLLVAALATALESSMDEYKMAWATQAQIALDSQTQEESPKSNKKAQRLSL